MPTTPLLETDEDEEDQPLTQEEIEAIFSQFPAIENMTATDALIMAGTLLDFGYPVPLDIIEKAHSGGYYFAH
jgi:hypothetical protein